jgi:hypothetical protein
MDECNFLNDQSLINLANSSPNLHKMRCCWCIGISGSGVAELCLKCLSLKELILIGLKSLNDEAFQKILDEVKDGKQCCFPQMMILNCTQCNSVSDSILTKIKKNYNQIEIKNYYDEEM